MSAVILGLICLFAIMFGHADQASSSSVMAP
jgi:hypothetical protein